MLKVASSSPPSNLESLLLARKLVTADQVSAIHQFIVENGTNFGTALMYMGILSPEKIAAVLLKEKKIRSASPQKIAFQTILKALLPPEKAKELQAFPLQLVDESGSRVLLLGMTDPLDSVSIHRAESISRTRVQPVFVSLDDLQWAYRKHFKTGLPLFPPEATNGGERTVSRRMDSINATPAQKTPRSSEIHALLGILVKKGILTFEEFDEELKKYGS